MKKLTEKTTGTLMTLGGVIVLSPDALLISAVRADTWTLVFWRGLLTAVTLALYILLAGRKNLYREGLRMGLPGAFVAMFFALSTISFVTSVRYTTAANTLVIVAAMPLVSAIFTRVFLGEKVPGRTWAAVIAGFAGIAVVFSGSVGGKGSIGDLLALATACLVAANFVIIRKYRNVDMLPAVVASGLATTVFSALLTNPLSVGAHDMALLAAIGLIVLPVPLTVMTVAPKLIPPAEVSLIMLLETFLGPFWVWLALGERPGIHTVLGGGILVATLVLHALAGVRRPWFRIPVQTAP